MTTGQEYARRIQQYAWKDLIALWEAIEAENTLDWPAGRAFECLVLRAFQLEGAYVMWPYRITMGELVRAETDETVEQVDGFIHTEDGLACLVECKDYRKDSVNVEPIAKLRNQLLRRPGGVIGIAFSRSGFTESALLLARFTAPQIILLWGGDEIEFALRNKYFCKGVAAKYRICVAKGLPDYNITRGVI